MNEILRMTYDRSKTHKLRMIFGNDLWFPTPEWNTRTRKKSHPIHDVVFYCPFVKVKVVRFGDSKWDLKSTKGEMGEKQSIPNYDFWVVLHECHIFPAFTIIKGILIKRYICDNQTHKIWVFKKWNYDPTFVVIFSNIWNGIEIEKFSHFIQD